jgi:hypothetical protein
MSGKAYFFMGLAAITIAAAGSAQVGQPPAQRERTEAFLEGKKQQQQSRAQRLGNAGSDLQSLNGLVRAVGLRLPAPPFVDDAEQRQRLGEAFLIDLSQELAMLGFTPGDVRASAGSGRALVEAAAARVKGGATLRQNILLSDTAAVARVSSINNSDDRGDGYLSTVTLTVVRPLSERISVGDAIELRRLSGQTRSRKVESSIEEPVVAGEEILLLASRAFYRNSTSARGNARAAVEITPFYRVSGSTLLPTSPFQAPANLNEIQAN